MIIKAAFVVLCIFAFSGIFISCGAEESQQDAQSATIEADSNSRIDPQLTTCEVVYVTVCCATAPDGGCGRKCTYRFRCCGMLGCRVS